MPEIRDSGPEDPVALETMKAARTAFENLIHDIRPELHRYCARMTGSVFDGEDIVQDTLAKAFYLLPQTTEIAHFRGWLFRIAHNRAIDHMRRTSRLPVESIEDRRDVVDPSPFSEQLPMRSEEMIKPGLPILMQLTPMQRGAVILKDVLDYSLVEVSEILDASLSSVKGALHRGRAALRRIADGKNTGTTEPAVDPGQTRLLNEYVRYFAAGEFDALRSLLARDVHLEVVNIVQSQGDRIVGNYFHRYGQIAGLRVRAALVEGRTAVLVFEAGELQVSPDYVILIESLNGRVTGIRDFRHARYIMIDLLSFSICA